MKNSVICVLLACCAVLTAEDLLMKNGVKAWSDRGYIMTGLADSFQIKNAVPVQKCSGYSIVLPKGSKKALIAIFNNANAVPVIKKYNLKPTGSSVYIGDSRRPKMLKYDVFAVDNPPEKIDCGAIGAGGILLALNDDVPEIKAPAAPVELPVAAVPEKLSGVQSFEGQEYRFRPGKRTVEYYVCAPKKGINANTGLMLVSHNWGGTWKYTAPWCDILSDRFNLICMSVNYLQSGEVKHDKVPYDHGVLQAMDCLRTLYEVMNNLDKAQIKFNRRRIYAAGASGGGNVSLMVNKLAPNTFGCIVDLCGMPGLTNDIAFGVGALNAGYSKDPKSPKYRCRICGPWRRACASGRRHRGSKDHLLRRIRRAGSVRGRGWNRKPICARHRRFARRLPQEHSPKRPCWLR